MRIILTALLFFSATSFIHAQHISSCCVPTATDKFAMNANDESFKRSHEEPLPFLFTSAQGGHDINFSTGGMEAHGWLIPAKKKSPYYIFVVHEWWGLNDYIKKTSEQLAKDLDVNVLALDMYDGAVASTREDAAKYMQAASAERCTEIIKGAYAYAGTQSKIFTIGWCFGGGWSLQTSIEGGEQAKGCIMYYGQPESKPERLQLLQCNVLGIFANNDQWISPKVVTEFKDNMAKVGKDLSVYQYDADHGFANPSNPKYDKKSGDDAYAKTLTFIKLRMK